MALNIGIVGLPNVGKSTLFNALTRSHGAQAANYPFCTIEPNTGIVEVPDERLSALSNLVSPQKTIPTTVEFVDIAGLVKGASKGEGLGNAFLHNIREVNAICHVVRIFENDDITHVDGSIDPKRDRETIETELILSDLQTLQNRVDKIKGAAKTGDKEKAKELLVYERLSEALNAGSLALSVELSDEEILIDQELHLLTRKPILYAVNVSESQLTSLTIDDIRSQLGLQDTNEAILVSAKIEEELQTLSADEAEEFLQDLGVDSSGLDRLIHAAYRLLGYITFFTAGEKEVRAWTVAQGSTAPQAAGVIHTDFEKGFIRAETIAYDDYIDCGSEAEARNRGKLRQEGKEYVVQDGDVFHFKFNI